MPSLSTLNLRPNDWVQVRHPKDILATLDSDGTLDGLVFMPEMLPYLGKSFQVLRRLEKTCIEGSASGVAEFRHNDVVFLDGLRCSGDGHDGCGRLCMLFWKEAWLKRLSGPSTPAATEEPLIDLLALKELQARLKTKTDDGKYFCQSTNLINATHPLSTIGRLWKCVRDVRVGTYGPLKMLDLIMRPLVGKVLLKFRKRYPSNSQTKTPSQSLGLQPGEWVEVKSVPEIESTLDSHGRNRGLQWSYDLVRYSNRRFKVAKRLDRLIVEYKGTMVSVTDTVLLEGAGCTCTYVTGGCPRADLIYWREIWLKRVDHAGARPTGQESQTQLSEAA